MTDDIQDPAVRNAVIEIKESLLNIEKSALHSESEITELKTQVGINCAKLDNLKKIGEGNQNSINELIKLVRGIPKS